MNGLGGLIGAFGGLISVAIGIVVAIALLVFFWGLTKFIFKAGDEKAQAEGRNTMVWGLIALFVMVSTWGIVEFFQASFNLHTPPDNIIDPVNNRGSGNPLFPPTDVTNI
jgi:hypothetical protein